MEKYYRREVLIYDSSGRFIAKTPLLIPEDKRVDYEWQHEEAERIVLNHQACSAEKKTLFYQLTIGEPDVLHKVVTGEKEEELPF